jgi:hypothetical protein
MRCGLQALGSWFPPTPCVTLAEVQTWLAARWCGMLLWKLAFRLCVLHRDGAGKAEQYAVTHPRHAGLIRANGYRPASRAHVYTIVQDPSRAPRSSHPQGNETPVRRNPVPPHPLYCTAPTESHAMAVVIRSHNRRAAPARRRWPPTSPSRPRREPAAVPLSWPTSREMRAVSAPDIPSSS